mmetsp:Transcript_27417/g.41685  ORF Transcript_27417/g.41685 Transcript_27417/m.41685 type:complete len:190 (+) Transcript_27417:438-1007(+)|eukprot:CAMPEP_0170496052 /NCGR_PEP_ID=MMETSP0208-20121228/19847_1 /TAXON_ID=197538 /ORGANISM="Strombidium inclinatum, Strain S3" /LENGTH=189 /DNA_ID=CAMNT_0010772481 /DNA_START=324 /DNA_END=893 /DNA_ORIENTATION=+
MGSGYRASEGVLPTHIKEMEELREFSEEVVDDDGYEDESGSQHPILSFGENCQKAIKEYDSHVKACNLDFRENVIKEAHKIKLKDTDILNKGVEEIKSQEATELGKLNKNYQELDMRAKMLDRKNERLDVIIESWIEQWRRKRLKKILYTFLKDWVHLKAREKRQLSYCDTFYSAGLKRRIFKGLKLWA